MNSKKIWYALAFCIVLISLLSGCGDQRAVYLPPCASGNMPSVKANPAMLAEGISERANLSPVLIEAYLRSFNFDENTKLFKETSIPIVVPHIKQALADYGNATVSQAYNPNTLTDSLTITVQQGHLITSSYGKKKNRLDGYEYRGQFPPFCIPPEAYEPLQN